jgi:hypothetical protein
MDLFFAAIDMFAKPPSSPGQDLLLDGKLNRMF